MCPLTKIKFAKSSILYVKVVSKVEVNLTKNLNTEISQTTVGDHCSIFPPLTYKYSILVGIMLVFCEDIRS